VILEDPKIAVNPDVNTGRLDELGQERVQLDAARLDLGPDVAIREQHVGNLSGSAA
jgi:hypothetical protein